MFFLFANAQQKNYPQGYFRNPLNIKMELVANFGELRSNHWHMGLDIRTQRKENLPVYAAAEGFVSRIKIEPGGFGRAIYIAHPNGLTTLYAHLNAFNPVLERWVKSEQYRLESWAVELEVPANMFPVKKGSFIAFSGNTGGSQGPHVHFEIRETKTDKCLNPMLFGFPIPDAVAPSLIRLAMYNRNQSLNVQAPQIMALKKVGASYSLAQSNLVKVGTDKISFAIGAVDRFSGYTNPNGIYSARILLDGELQSEFILDRIGYDETRYMNAQIDYRYKYKGGPYLQHISRMPGDITSIYTSTNSEGVIHLKDEEPHLVRIETRDAAQNLSVLQFNVQLNRSLPTPSLVSTYETWSPNFVNVFESENFEAYTTERSIYDTLPVSHNVVEASSVKAIGKVNIFMSPAIPVHESFIVRIKSDRVLTEEERSCTVILNTAGTKKTVVKAKWQGDWAWAPFRQFGTYQAFADDEPPTINAVPADLSKSSRIVFTPKDNFNSIKNFRAEVDGKWLCFTNDKGRTWIYKFDENFPKGKHELKVSFEDEAGNVTIKTWNVTR